MTIVGHPQLSTPPSNRDSATLSAKGNIMTGLELTLPSRQEAVLPLALEARAADTPDAPAVYFVDGASWSYVDLAERVWGLAEHLATEAGLKRGECLASVLPNGEEALLSWLATNSLGAVYAPFNTAYQGPQISYAVNLTQCSVLIMHADLAHRLQGLDLPDLRSIVWVGGEPPTQPLLGVQSLSFADLAGTATTSPELSPPLEPWDDCTVLMTSGTTGNSKAVRRTYAQYDRYTSTTFRLVGVTSEDRFYVCAPMFHGGADVPVFAMLSLGASLTIDARFTAHDFWNRVRRYQCTVTWMHSAMSLFLHKQPRSEDDSDNPLRLAMLAPLFDGFDEFAERFDLRIYMVYGMTEMSCIFSVIDPADIASLGVPADPGYELRIASEDDVPLPPGQSGELLVRHKVPWVITPGYLRDDAATARVWRNGWFHTGDVFVEDPDGTYRLVDRVKDSIRRRGENVSAAEVERQLLAMPEIREASAIGVAAEIEEEILVYVCFQDGVSLEPSTLHARLVSQLPYFAVPRYIALRDELPRNVALRVDKPKLRGLGIPADAWDAVEAGSVPTRERFTREPQNPTENGDEHAAGL